MHDCFKRVCLAALVSTGLFACSSNDEPQRSSANNGGAGGTGGGGTTTTATTGSGGTGAGGGAGSSGAAGAAVECEAPTLDNELEVAGAYRDNWDTAHVVNDQAWRMGEGEFSVVEFSNEEAWIVAENSADDPFNPSAFSRFEWTEQGDSLFYCQVVFDAPSADEAKAPPAADENDLDSGCSGFPWTELVSLELVGSYGDAFGGSHEINEAAWLMDGSIFHSLEFSNEERWLVTLNDCNNLFNPGQYSRFEWLWSTTGAAGAGGAGTDAAGGAAGAAGAANSATLYYCQIGYDLASRAAALALAPADPSDLAQGCNGFAWTELTPP